jgi:hypothetical protein
VYSPRHLLGAALAVAVSLSPLEARAAACCQDASGDLHSHNSLAAAFIELLLEVLVNMEPIKHPVSHSGRASSDGDMPGIRQFGLDGISLMEGGKSTLRGYLAIEGERLGVEARAALMSLPGESIDSGTDASLFTRLQLTYALVAEERIRLRLEAGASSLHSRERHLVGVSGGFSLEACIGGPFDWDLRAQLTPYPYWQLDATLGLALRIHVLSLRGGVQWLMVEESRLVNTDVRQASVLSPYVGAGFVF